ncbi:MAG: polyphosphate kinase 1 [Clostridiales bacterium]|nr:polyphosphate kinase 1 [Clostridiales bacterium]
MNIDQHKYYINRELSWLDFNNRVLDEVLDEKNPLLEKMKFLSITSSNLDEFFMVRVAGLEEQQAAGYLKKDHAGLSSIEQLDKISDKTHNFVNRQYSIYNKQLIPMLTKEEIRINKYNDLEGKQKKYINDYFDDIIFPILTPMAIDSGRPFPLLKNKAIYIVVSVTVRNQEHFAIIQLPKVFPRIIKIPEGLGQFSFIFAENLICANLSKIFKGNLVNSYSVFRITRSADLLFDEEDAKDLLLEIEHQVKQRKWGNPIRLEVTRGCQPALKNFLIESFSIDKKDLYYCDGPLDFTFLMDFSTAFIPKKKWVFPNHNPINPFINKDMFDEINKKDILLHFPYHSFQPVLDFLHAASQDPNVLAIKQTLYRVSSNSPVISALIKAAKNNIQVTVLVELKARFDEENNITWARTLEHAGCHVVYGLPNIKIHSKMLLIIRKEQTGIKRYVNIGTGNFNDKTAKLYTDFSLFTCREDFASDVTSLFNYLTGYTEKPILKKLVISPSFSREFFMRRINAEIDNAKAGLPARIVAVTNSLIDTRIIKQLYLASIAGVKIDLIVRGICGLKPSLKKISDNIRVVSIVGRFLEHTRVYYFSNNNKPLIYLGSADLMSRNLDRRVEVLFPIINPSLLEQVVNILNTQLKDTIKARFMKSDGTYSYYKKREFNSQEFFTTYY